MKGLKIRALEHFLGCTGIAFGKIIPEKFRSVEFQKSISVVTPVETSAQAIHTDELSFRNRSFLIQRDAVTRGAENQFLSYINN